MVPRREAGSVADRPTLLTTVRLRSDNLLDAVRTLASPSPFQAADLGDLINYQRVSRLTLSMWYVCGNMSTGWTLSSV
jgi:hypothetical protein